MRRIVFQPDSTWRKLGYALYSDSLSYREIINDNPQWDVLHTPPPGTRLKSSSSSSRANVSGLTQQAPITARPSEYTALKFFPFSSESEYYTSLLRYSFKALEDTQRLNGWSSNSVISDSGEIASFPIVGEVG